MILDNLRGKERLVVAGVMSGTSLDGVDVAFAEIWSEGEKVGYELLGLHSRPYTSNLRKHLLSASAGELNSREVAHLDVELGELYADIISSGIEDIGIDRALLDAVGLHGQTIYHDPSNGVTQQIGSAAVIAERLATTIVNDFRTADVASGGEGAPLVPFCDAILLHNPDQNRVALNIGGMANLTWLPANLDRNRLLAFDTGPGNVLMDGAMRELRGEDCDRDGKVAAEGEVDDSLLNTVLNNPWFAEPPPKSTGRERFGDEKGREFARNGRARGLSDGTILRTLATATARSIVDALRQHVVPLDQIDEIIVSGGGAKNRTLMELLQREAENTNILSSDQYGIPVDAKEALCFAILAWATLNGIPNNVPSVTGARGLCVLGAIRIGSS
ncbi:MAG: anhydro-N-acetylmuramic acid kinase [Ignavibacteriae bacterium]|nr:anhydro-N-acetylmuramic acid kinase [Ignavibacteriota bacterium]MCB9217255.1 anhydro-N-acetylmuramic acid kinase [Ignavibacteria bacterium]